MVCLFLQALLYLLNFSLLICSDSKLLTSKLVYVLSKIFNITVENWVSSNLLQSLHLFFHWFILIVLCFFNLTSFSPKPNFNRLFFLVFSIYKIRVTIHFTQKSNPWFRWKSASAIKQILLKVIIKTNTKCISNKAGRACFYKKWSNLFPTFYPVCCLLKWRARENIPSLRKPLSPL